MKKLRILFFGILGISIPLGTGCSSTPKHSVVPVFTGTNSYTVAQAPVKLEVVNEGRQWKQFVREYNAERLGHNLRLAQIEHLGAEQRFATNSGVNLADLEPPVVVAQAAVPGATGGAIYPTGHPYSGASSAIYPTGHPYAGMSSAIYPTGYPYPTSGYGNKWWQFFGGGSGITVNTYHGYNGIGVGGFSYWSGLAGGRGACKTYPWQSTPGLRHFYGSGGAIYPGSGAIYPGSGAIYPGGGAIYPGGCAIYPTGRPK